MPQIYKLTWQPGTNGRKGRWRKKYNGDIHYFPECGGKTDTEAREAAEAEWEKRMVRIKAQVSKARQAA